MPIIGICGPKGAGKTTLADLLCEEHGYTPIRFSDPLKEMLRALLLIQKVPSVDIARMIYGDLKEEPSPFLGGRSPRVAMQTLGTEWRDMISRDLWAGIWTRRVLTERTIATRIGAELSVVADDVRYVHEVDAIQRLSSSVVILVTRPGVPSVDDHPSEQGWHFIKPDLHILNYRRPEHMLERVNAYLSKDIYP